ncbi:MAG: hypothetical protein ABIR46_00115 [Candidatus Saccharimonadales bacterium]
MMTQISEQIRQAISLLQKESDALKREIKDMDSRDSKTKTSMHSLELRIISEALTENTPNQASRMWKEAKELHDDKQILHQDQVTHKQLSQKLNDLQKKITTFEFWMKFANTDDEVKQEQARRKVFG